jgi:2-dehydropantoate 2-reductase
VKAYHTLAAAQSAALIPGEAPVLTLQNGLGNWEALAEHLPLARILAGTTSSGATLLAEGHIREAGVGIIRLGAPNALSAAGAPLAERAADLLRSGGLAAEVAADIEPVLWHKAMVNAAVNPLTALSGLRNGEMWADPSLRAQAIAVAEEVLAVADECGIALRPLLGAFPPADALADVCRLTADNRTSMLQDILFGRPTEIDAINGEIARRARDCGLRAPLCEQMAKKVRALPRGE